MKTEGHRANGIHYTYPIVLQGGQLSYERVHIVKQTCVAFYQVHLYLH